MAYVEGFVVPVPAANKEAYRRYASEAMPLFHEFGVTRLVEAWGDDVPDGAITDFKGAVNAEPGEVVVLAWLEYPDRATRDAAVRRMTEDPRAKSMSETMPFDGKRLIYGGFSVLQADGGARGAYIDGSVLPVPAASEAAFRDLSALQSAAIMEHGALRVVDAWGDDIPEGKLTDFRRAVKVEAGEIPVFSWVEWPSKEVRDAAWPKLMEDPRMHEGRDLYDGRRRIFGGFSPIVDG